MVVYIQLISAVGHPELRSPKDTADLASTAVTTASILHSEYLAFKSK